MNERTSTNLPYITNISHAVNVLSLMGTWLPVLAIIVDSVTISPGDFNRLLLQLASALPIGNLFLEITMGPITISGLHSIRGPAAPPIGVSLFPQLGLISVFTSRDMWFQLMCSKR